MKYRIIISLLPLLLICLIAVPSEAQDDAEFLYMKVDYMRATGPQMADYLEVEQEIWKPMHQERFNRGIILSWDFYAVFAGDQADSYNYIAVNVFDDFDKIDYYDLNTIAQQVYPDLDISELMEQTRASREVVRTEVWKVNKRLFKEGQTSPGGTYATTSFFKEMKDNGQIENTLLDFESEIHRKRIEQNTLNSWGLYTLLYPKGKSTPYTNILINYYDDMIDLIQPSGLYVAREVYSSHDDAGLEALLNQIERTRSVSKTEIWKRLDFIGRDQ